MKIVSSPSGRRRKLVTLRHFTDAPQHPKAQKRRRKQVPAALNRDENLLSPTVFPIPSACNDFGDHENEILDEFHYFIHFDSSCLSREKQPLAQLHTLFIVIIYG